MLNSAEFEHSDRSRPLLRFLVESAVEGRESELKESVIGVEVFDRDVSYSPRADPVVRVTVGRLRSKLERYYQREGARDSLRITIPKGAYVPVFERCGPEPVAMAPPAAGRPVGLKVWIAAVALGAVALAAVWMVRWPRPPALDRLRPFITTGSPYHPAFSPAGDVLSFDALGQGNHHRNVFLQRLDAASPTRLGDDTVEECCAVWSPDGSQLAFLRNESSDAFGIFLLPVVGGSPRKLAELRRGATPWLSWSPDGRWLAAAEPSGENKPGIELISLATGVKRAITISPAGWHGDSLPIFSADSNTITFRRTGLLSGHEDVYTVPVTGGAIRRITFDDRGISGLVLLGDDSLLMSSKRAGSIRSLWWQARGGRAMQRVTSTTVDAGNIAVSRDGKHFALVPYFYDLNIWSVPADGSAPARPLINSEMPDSSPQYSPDGRRLAFHSVRTGNAGLWISDSGGANAVLLVDGRGFEIGNEQWAPDGRQLAFEWHVSGRSAVYVVSSDGGVPQPLVADRYENGGPVWAHDGAHIYFNSDRDGHARIWRVGTHGDAAVAITPPDAVSAKLSHEENALYYLRVHPADTVREVYRQPLNGGLPAGEPAQVLAGLAQADWANWTPANNGLYYVHRQPGLPHEIRYVDFATHAVNTVWKMQNPAPAGGGLTVSPDGKTILFTQTDRDGSAIYVQ